MGVLGLNKLALIVGAALAAASIALAGPVTGVAVASTDSGGITPDLGPVVIASSAPAVTSPTISSGADADATAGPGGAGSLDRPANSLSTQDSGNNKGGATVNTTGIQSNDKSSSTDGSMTTQSYVAAPQWKALSSAATAPAI